MRIRILKELKTAWAGKTCLCFDILESTQEYAKELVMKEGVHGTLITANTQTAGKGRRGRVWQSMEGTTISMSLCLEPKILPQYISGVTLVMALAVAKAILDETDADPKIKWPNDIVINGKKVCGILTELHMKSEGYAVVVGVGINVNTEEFPEEICNIASSLKRETGKMVSREKLIASVLNHFEVFYEKYEQTRNLALLKEDYEELLINRGKQVQVLDPAGAYEGIAKGITEEGKLIVVKEDGSKIQVDSGEVSVRGLYGYV